MNVTVDVFLPISLALIMFALGVGLTSKDFLFIAKHPRALLVGMFCQIALLPLAAFALVLAWNPDPKIAFGVILVACAPGGAVSNLFTSLARGDVALSVALTAVSSLLCAVTVPVVLFVASHLFLKDPGEGQVSYIAMSFRLFLMVTLPVLAGMAVRRIWAPFALGVQSHLLLVSAATFFIVLSLAIVEVWEVLPGFFAESGSITLTLLVTMIVISYAAAAGSGLDETHRTTISIEAGVQNGTLAVAIATGIYNGGKVLIPAVTYGLLAYLPILLLVFIARRKTISRSAQ